MREYPYPLKYIHSTNYRLCFAKSRDRPIPAVIHCACRQMYLCVFRTIQIQRYACPLTNYQYQWYMVKRLLCPIFTVNADFYKCAAIVISMNF